MEKILEKTKKIIEVICSICEEKTTDFFICDGCGKPVCSLCAEDHLQERGNGIDDVVQLCSTCVGMK